MTSATKSDLQKTLASLRPKLSKGRKGGQPWFVLGSLLFQAFATTPREHHAAIRAEAVRATLISAGVLRRYVVLFDRLRTIAAAEGLDPDALMSPVFNAAEVAVQIYGRDAREGLIALRDLMVRDTTLAELREQRSKMPDTGAVYGILSQHDLKSAFVFRALEAARPCLWPESDRLRRRPSSDWFADRSGLEIIGGDTVVLGGIEILSDHQDIDRFMRDIPALLTLATFYDRFYLAHLPSLPGSLAKRVDEGLQTFRAASVGILRIAKNGRVEEVVRPAGPPEPNRIADYPLVIGTADREPAEAASTKLDPGWQP